ncbi:MAG: hypothetical protein H0V89_03015 [Deltaproteobacteria bacterium]|nr:hypothetical protein [Deltaproteobacteria bacterium]
MRTPWIFAALLACGGDAPSSDADPISGDDAPVTGTGDPSPPDEEPETGPTVSDPSPHVFYGTVPPVALAAPVFTDVVNQDVALRSQADLLGHPTVMWFYPAAGTGG